MMGMEVRDPDGVEGDIRQLPGFGIASHDNYHAR